MANPSIQASYKIDISREVSANTWELICGITSYDFEQTRSVRETFVRDCATAHAVPTRIRQPGLKDAKFSGSGKLAYEYMDEYKAMFEASTATKFKITVNTNTTFTGDFVFTSFKINSDAIDEAGYIECSIALEAASEITWTVTP